MQSKTTSVSLAELIYTHVESLSTAELSACRAELIRTLPAYVDEVAKRARARITEMEIRDERVYKRVKQVREA